MRGAADIDAIVYLREWVNAWREVEVVCYCGDTEFCRALEARARHLWQGRPNEIKLVAPTFFLLEQVDAILQHPIPCSRYQQLAPQSVYLYTVSLAQYKFST